MMRSTLRGLVAAPALALFALACSSPPPPAAPKAPEPPPVAAEPEVVPPSEVFAAARDRIVDEWLVHEPSLARMLGLHDGDGKIADYSAAGLKARIAWLEKARDELAPIEVSALLPDEALDLAILKNEIALHLFRLVDLDQWEKRPQFYDELFAVNGYLDRDYAPLADRVKKLVEHEEAALAQVKNVRANLKSPMSKAVVETAVKIYAGYAEYLRGDVDKLVRTIDDKALIDRFSKANEALAKEAAALADHLKNVEVPKGDASHVLGVDRYKKLLEVQEGLTIPLSEFKEMGEKNLAVNKAAYEALKKKGVKMTRPKASELLKTATEIMDASRQFVIDQKIVTIPTDDKAILKETPPYMQWNAAFLDPPGPFEGAGQNAFYYITMPNPAWPKKEQTEYIMTRGILMATSIHEVYPGHFLQGQWVKQAPTRVQKVFGAYSFVEGWAHYIEQMMVEEGFGKEKPENAMGQLSDALLRNCRFVVSLGVHAEGMSLDDAEKRFMTDCFQDKATAREQAVRATFDPGYFAYTLGKVQILALRDEAKKKLGAKFSLRRFHDELLAHGSPVVPLIHDRVLADLVAGTP